MTNLVFFEPRWFVEVLSAVTKCIFKRNITCEDVQDDDISGWLIMLTAKVVVWVLTYNDDGDESSRRKSKNRCAPPQIGADSAKLQGEEQEEVYETRRGWGGQGGDDDRQDQWHGQDW